RSATAATADADRLDPARPHGRGPTAADGQGGGFATRRPLREPQPPRSAIHRKCVSPSSAISADLEPQIIVADQPQFGPPAPAALEQQRQDVAGPLFVEGEAQVPVTAAVTFQRGPQ